ncbi:hypothetical protein Corgl_0025 [Coriobacterium glomerans PW2]|uniref:Uncharacterized protein n=1 Tax=Coriobacterium glomerans (strain ATCC 49209 / DSM 20642 / JCM 10262 / PW2) TaxID=700015 RepID=F2N6V6_CORGP|nr:hypothetical protein [Coriobacterium glomerans]AEB06155.1 hypothetical protein Corgl_0025 [Coriobacterium glomerans PW2]
MSREKKGSKSVDTGFPVNLGLKLPWGWLFGVSPSIAYPKDGSYLSVILDNLGGAEIGTGLSELIGSALTAGASDLDQLAMKLQSMGLPEPLDTLSGCKDLVQKYFAQLQVCAS